CSAYLRRLSLSTVGRWPTRIVTSRHGFPACTPIPTRARRIDSQRMVPSSGAPPKPPCYSPPHPPPPPPLRAPPDGPRPHRTQDEGSVGSPRARRPAQDRQRGQPETAGPHL